MRTIGWTRRWLSARQPLSSQAVKRTRYDSRIFGLASAGCLGYFSAAYALQKTTLIQCDDSPSQPEETKWWESLNPSKNLDEISSSISTQYTLLSRLYSELSGDDDSLYQQIVTQDRFDKILHPEIEWQSKGVRLSQGPSLQEKAFLRSRRRVVREAFAKFIGVDESEVDEEDVPTIGIASSGGGMREAVNTIGSLVGAKECGILDCTSYIAGISGSTWALSVLYSSLTGGNVHRLADHFASRIQTDFFDMETLELLTSSPSAAHLLSGAITKSITPKGELTLVDAYGVLLSSRLYLPAGYSVTTDPQVLLNRADLKLSNAKEWFAEGQLPLPIYSVIRHDIPQLSSLAVKESAAIVASTTPSIFASKEKQQAEAEQKKEEANKELKETKWQWIEMTPFELSCQEIGASIEMWAFGREFNEGKQVGGEEGRRQEISLSVLSGVFASAFCATLQHYYREVKPLLQAFPWAGQIDTLIQSYESSLSSIHPFPPSEFPNPFKGLKGRLKEGSPDSIADGDTLALADAGLYCNLPYTPLFQRNCDVVIALDASADSHALWFQRAQEYATQLGMDKWPKIKYDTLFPADASIDPTSPEAKLGEAEKQASATEEDKVDPEKDQTQGTNDNQAEDEKQPELGKVNFWIGSTRPEHKDVQSRLIPGEDDIERESKERDGVALIYLPLRADKEIESVWSTWNFKYAEKDTRKLLRTAQDNFEPKEIKKCLKGIWKRKRQYRLRNQSADALTM